MMELNGLFVAYVKIFKYYKSVYNLSEHEFCSLVKGYLVEAGNPGLSRFLTKELIKP